jgi:tetratricopeptide (TPR) repeat protein
VGAAEQTTTPKSPELRAQLATAYNSWGVLEKSVDPKQAANLYAKALQIRDQLATETNDVAAQRELAKSLANMAELDLSQGNRNDAVEKMERCVTAWETTVAKAPDNLSHKVGLADALRNLALVYAARGEVTKASDLAERAQAAHDQVSPVPLRFTSNRLRTVRLRAFLKSRSTNQADREMALQLLSDASDEWELVLKRSPAVESRYAQEASECFADFGAFLYNSGDTQRTCAYLEKAVDCALASTSDNRGVQAVSIDRLFKILGRLFRVNAKLERSTENAQVMGRVRKAYKDSPADLVELVAVVGSSYGQTEMPNELRDEVLKTLEAAIAGGYNNLAKLRQLKMSGLGWLGKSPEFEKLVLSLQE